MKNIHIGILIEKELIRQERSPSWLATKLCCCRTNVYKIFGRKSIDSDMLFRISRILNHNFFEYYCDKLNEDCEKKGTKE